MQIEVGRLVAVVADIFRRAGCSAEEGQAIADGLVDANLTGHDSHGVVRVPRYIGWLQRGEVEAGRNVATLSETGSLCVLDGQYGFGATVGRQAVEYGLAKAAELGMAVVSLRHAGHLGRIGQWAERAAERGMVSMHLVNVASSAIVAPFGGTERRFSTAPMAFGFPLPDEPPVILDYATSAVAEGKVLVAANGGKKLPDCSLITADGRLSADPATLYGPLTPGGPRDAAGGTGAIRAMGEHKGSGLALICELMAGALTGSGTSGPGDKRFANGMLSIYLSPAALGSHREIAREARDFLAWVRDTRPAQAGERVLIPGEPERLTRADRLENGIPLADEIWERIERQAVELGVNPASYLFR